MAESVKLFLSGVSAEFQSHREALALCRSAHEVTPEKASPALRRLLP